MSAIQIVIVGVVATTILDLYQQLLRMTLGFSRTNWALVGRWIALMPRGRFLHRPITGTPAVKGEDGVGWLFHYLIGIVFAGLYLYVVFGPLGSEPGLFSGLAFGLAALAFPWFVMHPALGYGICSVKREEGGKYRIQNLTSHLVFGAALYLGWIVVEALAKAQ